MGRDGEDSDGQLFAVPNSPGLHNNCPAALEFGGQMIGGCKFCLCSQVPKTLATPLMPIKTEWGLVFQIPLMSLKASP